MLGAYNPKKDNQSVANISILDKIKASNAGRELHKYKIAKGKN